MPAFRLEKDKIAFPPAQFADNDGFLAEGGDITAEWVLEGHKNGFFSWNHPMRYPNWYSPDPRTVMFPRRLEVPEAIASVIAKSGFEVKFDTDLEKVMKFIQAIENARPMNHRWLTGKMILAYLDLEKKGHTFSVSVYRDGEPVGGFFGTKVNRVYFGEFVNGTEKYAAEYALIALSEKLKDTEVIMIDLQKPTCETAYLGHDEISRNEYLHLLKENI